ncbi:PAS domain S-box-containing protein [Mucilaginibacter frigoritolerans]|jgi:two-component system, OmpR family, sensor histidine kinase VicK|uniref:histidine kinase n=1 Tax=Mucilaginibacter frigoritolerans TaxID=652788 RepID=A0A562UFH7_9SPHI|nr:ATP-binding protein [Mucilaginibacter frigoritolerans]TWJ04493.1 PAS domain S-box-containing protein [Mucilaginibacter frigoritolerans]
MSVDAVTDLPENIFQLIFEKSPGSLLVKANPPYFTILAVSDSYLSITSSTREGIIGKGFFEAFPDDKVYIEENIRARHIFNKVIVTRQKIDVPNYRFDVINEKTKEKEIHFWSCGNTPIFGADNNVAYILNTVVDITEEVNAKEAALESESRLRLATDAAELATWDLDLETQTFVYSPRLAEIFGSPVCTDLSLIDIRSRINPDDMQNIVMKAYFEALVTGNYLYEVRVNWPNGSLHWVRTQGVVIKDEKKRPVRMLGTILDITESKRDEIRKNDFIAMASHELKTPLTSIKAYLQILAKKLSPLQDTFVTNALMKAGYQVNKMSDLIHGFLDLSKLESGKLQLQEQLFDINKLITDVIADINAVSVGNYIKFKYREPIFINADKEKIEQVISNFLSNAIKYSDKGSKIHIGSKKDESNLVVSVADEGIGIKLKDQEKLFQRFYRVESEKMKNISGFGIGLYLASEIILRHKGRIWVESDDNAGSTFYFSLPLPDVSK